MQNDQIGHEIFCVLYVYDGILVISEMRVVGSPLLPIFLSMPSCHSSFPISLSLSLVALIFLLLLQSSSSCCWRLEGCSWRRFRLLGLFDFSIIESSSTCTLNLILCKFLFSIFPFDARCYLFHCVEIILGIMVSLLWL